MLLLQTMKKKKQIKRTQFSLRDNRDLLPAEVAQQRLHLLLPVVAMASERGHLPPLLLQPLGDLRLLLGGDLLASPL